MIGYGRAGDLTKKLNLSARRILMLGQVGKIDDAVLVRERWGRPGDCGEADPHKEI
ncbi:MAG: hypothetical protein LBJ64_04035 [Deltaproteobacteria bacterium]|nr:hypothetical protein [Deltaproteobacteria bacterium]